MNICFVAHFAYGALTNDASLHIGGVERQTAMMARWLADAGHNVSVVTWAEGRAGDEMLDGVRVVKACRREEGLPGLRFFMPRWLSLNQAMARADADIYYQNCAESVTGQVALWARRNGRKFVYSVASDPECDPELPILHSFRERWLYRYGLTHADAILVQTRAQQQALQAGFGLDSVLRKMPSAISRGRSIDQLLGRRSPKPRVVWLGRLARVKNLDRLFAVAERLPEVHFDVVGGEDQEPEYARAAVERGNGLANVTMHGRLGHQDILPMLERAWMLLCTSDYEGFPNTFLESWAFARPVVSTVDPDNLISELGIGACGVDADALVNDLRGFCSDSTRLDAASRKAFAYFHENHALDRAMQGFIASFEDVLR